MPSYEPQSFETRHGECTIEQGVVQFHGGVIRTTRQTIRGVQEMDSDALRGPSVVFFTALGAIWTLQDLLIDMFDGRLWAVLLGLFVVAVLGWQWYLWLRRWLLNPSKIRCSDIESVTRVGKDTLRIKYKHGPRRTHYDVKLPRKKTDDKRRLATRAFEEKGFEVERATEQKWYRELV